VYGAFNAVKRAVGRKRHALVDIDGRLLVRRLTRPL
jgi:hypothetical protein